jgi:hypothetical protein
MFELACIGGSRSAFPARRSARFGCAAFCGCRSYPSVAGHQFAGALAWLRNRLLFSVEKASLATAEVARRDGVLEWPSSLPCSPASAPPPARCSPGLTWRSSGRTTAGHDWLVPQRAEAPLRAAHLYVRFRGGRPCKLAAVLSRRVSWRRAAKQQHAQARLGCPSCGGQRTVVLVGKRFTQALERAVRPLAAGAPVGACGAGQPRHSCRAAAVPAESCPGAQAHLLGGNAGKNKKVQLEVVVKSSNARRRGAPHEREAAMQQPRRAPSEPNSSIERTNQGKPWFAAHVER